MERRRITVEGTVQGVGFRPYVHGLASRWSLAGLVRNESGAVVIEVEGSPEAVEGFLRDLPTGAPPLAVIGRVDHRPLRPRGDHAFAIAPSHAGGTHASLTVAPDTAPCAACLGELRDPADRRHGYPFLNCTRCGPRYTVVTGVPYDRCRTTMADFELCPACRREYADPTDRRFHAQPTACPACGPSLRLVDPAGRATTGADPLEEAAALLRRGSLLAVKGLGGWHLVCDAADAAAVARLRKAKAREARPLAVMVRDLAAASALCEMDEAAAAELASVRRPIVLLPRRRGAPVAEVVAPGAPVAEAVAPGASELGVMLPYTPVHELLLAAVDRPLVMTSGNRSGEPIAFQDDDALTRLGPLVDGLLGHDRPIAVRCDDSVVRPMASGITVLRRSRGHVPAPFALPVPAPRPLLAVGGHLKNTFALARDGAAFVSHHVGDLDGPRAWQAFRDDVAHLQRLLDVRPAIVAHDLHPDYLTTRYATGLEGVERVAVQHHHAHVASLMAEHGRTDPVLGVAFDGSGAGPDGTVWGGEILLADLADFRRIGWLEPVPLPGGEAAVREPWRMAASHLVSAGVDPDEIPHLLPEARPGWPLLRQALARGLASPRTSSVGRLFDAVAALLGLRARITYEAQAAMALEAAAGRRPGTPWDVDLVARDGGWSWNPARIFQRIFADLATGRARGDLARDFHATVAEAVRTLCLRSRDAGGPGTVGLTGGVFQNALLVELTRTALEGEGFRVLLHRRVPPNDGGLALGQAAVAAARLAGPKTRTAEEAGARRARPAPAKP
ncbi:MAG: carbamoyltransferase HypF [Gemmatimonadetes bacterium]|nr:carbamoyltransferase HypF [Gemmatimonadota bacterium]